MIFGVIKQIYHIGRGICEKYQSRDETFPESKGERNVVSRLVFFANTPPNMIYLFKMYRFKKTKFKLRVILLIHIMLEMFQMLLSVTIEWRL